MPEPVHDPKARTMMELIRINNKHQKGLRGHAETVRRMIRENEREIKSRLSQQLNVDVGHLTITYSWKCKEAKQPEAVSPIGYCVYNEMEDRCLDFCLYCGHPEERK